jgi:hypothetical protein
MRGYVNYYHHSVYKLLFVNLRRRLCSAGKKKRCSGSLYDTEERRQFLMAAVSAHRSGGANKKVRLRPLHLRARQHGLDGAGWTPSTAGLYLASTVSMPSFLLAKLAKNRCVRRFCGQAHEYPQDRMCETAASERRRFLVQVRFNPDTGFVQALAAHINP